jgi:hypothetical protein
MYLGFWIIEADVGNNDEAPRAVPAIPIRIRVR